MAQKRSPRRHAAPLEMLMRHASRYRRTEVVLLCLALVAAGFAQSLFGGGDSLLRWLSGEPAFEVVSAAEVAQPDTAEVAHLALEPGISCAGMPADGEPVRFLMQNVQNYIVPGERQRSRYVMHPKSAEAREQLADAMAAQRPDVIGVTEIGGPVSLQDLRLRLEQRGLSFPYWRVVMRHGEDRALGILSRYPIVADDSQAEMPLFGAHRRRMMRGLLDVTLRAEDGRLFRLMGVHLKSRVAEDPSAAAALRSKEAHTVAMHLQRVMRQQPAMPILLFGDWNDTPNDASVKLVQRGLSGETAMHRLEPRDSRGEEWTHYYGRGKTYYVFDHLMVNRVSEQRMGKHGTACGIAEPRSAKPASDHRALWCELR